MRRCSRTACSAPAVATLTYVYADKAAVLGPLSTSPDPGSYDLCINHAERTSAPMGWEVIKIPLSGVGHVAPEPATDDLMALAEAVRNIGLRHDDPVPVPGQLVGLVGETEDKKPSNEANGQRGHLRLVPTTD